MRATIKKILKEEFNDKHEEKFYQLFKSYMDKRYQLLTTKGEKFDRYTGNLIDVYRFQVWDIDYYQDTFDVKPDGTVFNTPTTIDIKENFGLSSKEFKKFLLRFINDYK
jgi:hypothetical protein